jgi:selenocysteine lyase/cysteine desulfurase
VKKDRIKDIWPLFPAPEPLGDNIRKFEHVGTQPEALKLAVGEAVTFHHGLGGENKQERLRYLRDYWAKQLEKLRGVRILTSYSPEQSCGIGTFTVDHLDISKLTQVLFEKHKIYSIPVGIPEDMIGIRVTPSVYTTLQELDVFIEAVDHYITNGLPS